jgi:hypothetical protein
MNGSDLDPKSNDRRGLRTKRKHQICSAANKTSDLGSEMKDAPKKMFGFCIDIDCIDASVADPGCLSRIQGQKDSGSRIRIKNFVEFSEIDPGSSSLIRILIFTHPGSRGKKRHRIPDPDL